MEITCPSCGKQYSIPEASVGEQGRKVRCTACDHRWMVMPGTVEDEEAAALAEVLDHAAEEIDRFGDGDGDEDDFDPDEEAAALEAAFDSGEPDDDEEPDSDADPFVTDGEPREPAAAQTRSVSRNRIREPGRFGSVLAIGGWLLVLASVLALGGLVIARDEVVDAYPSTLPFYQAMGLPVTRRLGLEIRDVATETVEREGARVLRVSGAVHNVTSREREVPMIVIRLLDAGNSELEQQLVMVDRPTLPTESIARFVVDIEQPPETAETFSVSFDPGR